MAQGSIRKHERDSGVRYEVVVDLGTDPVTGRRRQRSKSFKTKRAAQAALATMLAEIDKGTAVDRSRQTVAEMMQYRPAHWPLPHQHHYGCLSPRAAPHAPGSVRQGGCGPVRPARGGPRRRPGVSRL
jgi:hypothetical protein